MKLPNIRLLGIRYRTLLVIVSITMVSIFVISLGSQYYSSIEKYITEKLRAINRSNLNQAGMNVDAQLNQLKSITEIYGHSEELLKAVFAYDGSGYGNKFNLQKTLDRIRGKSSRINVNISSIVIVTEENVIPSGDLPIYRLTRSDFRFVPGLDDAISAADGSAVFVMPSSFPPGPDCPDSLKELLDRYSFAIELRYLGRTVGTMFFVCRDNFFGDILSDARNMVVFDRQDNLLYNSAGYDAADALAISDGNGEMMVYTSSGFSGIRIGFISDRQEMESNVDGVRLFFFVFILILLVVAIVLATFLSRVVTRPVKQLISQVDSYAQSESGFSRVFKPVKSGRFTLGESILFFLVGMVTLSSAILLGIAYFFFTNIIEDYVYEAADNAFRQTVSNIEQRLQDVSYISANIVYEDSFQQAMQLSDIPQSTVNTLRLAISRELPLYNSKTEISLYQKNGRVVTTFLPQAERLPFNPGSDSAFFQNSGYIFRQTQVGPDGSYYIPFWIKVSQMETFKTVGYMECRLNELDMEKLYSSLNKDYSEVFIVDADGVVISHANKNLIGTHVDLEEYRQQKKNPSLLFTKRLFENGWQLVAAYDDNIIEADKTTFLLNEIYLFIIILLITFLVAFLFSRNLPGFFRKLSARVRSLSFDNLDLDFPADSGIDEINRLSLAFGDMATRIEYLLDEVVLSTQKAAKLEKNKNRAEFTALQAQINPHFLYNTFESINWMIRKDNKSEALYMIGCLSSMLRFVAKKEIVLVRIGEELAYTKTYVEIMKTRYEDELTVSFDVDESLMDCKIIKLVLQPLIENAIYHGIRPAGRPGSIYVGGRRMGDYAQFTVSDDGVGMDSESLHSLNEILSQSFDPDKIGLQNVQARLRLFYGESFGLFLSSGLGFGTTVTFSIPIREE